MLEQIIIAGSGGQGIMLMGKVLAAAAMESSLAVTWIPCYGAEVRGGAAYCMVTLSDDEISSPYIDTADTLFAMNMLSYGKFIGRLKGAGMFIANSSLIKKNKDTRQKALFFPFTDIAVKLGNIKVANMVALGCYVAAKKLIDTKVLMQVVAAMAPKDKEYLIDINIKAIESGMRLFRERV